jgi:hypothetical protein
MPGRRKAPHINRRRLCSWNCSRWLLRQWPFYAYSRLALRRGAHRKSNPRHHAAFSTTARLGDLANRPSIHLVTAALKPRTWRRSCVPCATGPRTSYGRRLRAPPKAGMYFRSGRRCQREASPRLTIRREPGTRDVEYRFPS